MSRQGSWERKLWEDIDGLTTETGIKVDLGGEVLNTQSSNSLDELNSSSTPLLAGTTFTGPWVDVGTATDILTAVATDQDGTYSVQFSPDGVNQDSTLTRQYRTNQINVPHRFTITRKYYRVVFTNTSTTDQTFFRIQSHIGVYSNLNAPIDGTIAQDFDSIVVRPTDYRDEVALGLRQGKTLWHKWGYNQDIDTTSEEMIVSEGGNRTFLTTASTLSLVSSDVNDVDSGTGAHGVVLYGIDSNRKSQIEVVLLNGTTPVITGLTWLGINRMALFRSGSSQVNEGTLIATATSDASVQAHMPSGEGTTQQAIFFTQAGHTALATGLLINALKQSGGSSPKLTIKAWVLSFVSNSKYEVFRYSIDTSVENHLDYPPEDRFPVGENSVLYFTAGTDTNNTTVGLRFSIIESRLSAT
jgi:hypothetical protein